VVTIKLQDMYVDVKAESFRTRVQLPPPPPSHNPTQSNKIQFSSEPLRNKGFFYCLLSNNVLRKPSESSHFAGNHVGNSEISPHKVRKVTHKNEKPFIIRPESVRVTFKK
jgi:hypothetical protein